MLALAVAGALVTTACTGEDPGRQLGSPAGGEPSAGAGGVDDPYFPHFGNAGYQVEHYQLAVTYDPAGKELTGEATIQAVATADLGSFSLDLTGLTARDVAVDGAGVKVEQDDQKLRVGSVDLAEGAEFTVTVTYDGTPEPIDDPLLGANGFRPTGDGAFAIGEPRSASSWFPVNDHPSDKATYEIDITVPDGLAAVSNGVPEGRTPAAEDGWTTWHWSEPDPMASYLTVLAIGDYRVRETEHAGLPMVVAVHSDLPSQVDDQLADTGEIADALADWFGPYPFAAYGGIVLADPSVEFALETQSRPIYGPVFFCEGGGGGDCAVRDGTWVIVHELAHQWFGNSVSLNRWQDIWLNEGFATYAEWLFAEAEGGDTAAETFDLYWDGPGAEDAFWSVPPGDPGADRLFDRAVYLRGGMTVHALRVELGDEAFFKLLRAWPEEHRYGNATTEDLIALSERISGRPLDQLFDAWLYTADRPQHPGAG